VVHNAGEKRYEAVLDEGVVGFAAYREAGERLIFTHTEVDEALEGRGIGSRLVRGLLDDVRERGVQISVHCPFIRAYMERHPEYEELLARRDS
jgi:predicted GNAT family acetyltransferase